MKLMILAFTIVALTMAAMATPARALEGIPGEIRNPQDLMQWITEEFQYKMKIPDNPQSVQETLRLRSGDCDDIACLAYAAIKRMGVECDIVVVDFKGLSVKHAVCLWKDNSGIYHIISNKRMYNTYKETVRGAIEKFYPDWEKITYSNEYRQDLRAEYRGSRKISAPTTAILSY